MVRGWDRWWFLLGSVVVAVACASSAPSPQPQAATSGDFDPLEPTRLMQEGQALVSQGRFQEGMDRFRRASVLQPQNPTIHNLMGMAQLQHGDAVKALEQFNVAVSLAPTYSDARNNRGASYMRLGQLSLAEADFLTVLGDMTYSNRAGVYFNLGSLYLARGNLAAAEENLRKAATASGPVEAFVYLGQVQERLGKQDLAENAYRSAMRRAPERADIPLRLAMLLREMGRDAEAEVLLQEVVSLAPDSPEALQARQLLEQ